MQVLENLIRHRKVTTIDQVTFFINTVKAFDGALESGPYYSSDKGWHMYELAIDFAEQLGYDPGEGTQRDPNTGFVCSDELMDVLDEAEKFLNAYFAYEGYEWTSHPHLNDWGYYLIDDE
jgi:hypothetical protein